MRVLIWTNRVSELVTFHSLSSSCSTRMPVDSIKAWFPLMISSLIKTHHWTNNWINSASLISEILAPKDQERRKQPGRQPAWCPPQEQVHVFTISLTVPALMLCGFQKENLTSLCWRWITAMWPGHFLWSKSWLVLSLGGTWANCALLPGLLWGQWFYELCLFQGSAGLEARVTVPGIFELFECCPFHLTIGRFSASGKCLFQQVVLSDTGGEARLAGLWLRLRAVGCQIHSGSGSLTVPCQPVTEGDQGQMWKLWVCLD